MLLMERFKLVFFNLAVNLFAVHARRERRHELLRTVKAVAFCQVFDSLGRAFIEDAVNQSINVDGVCPIRVCHEI